MKETPYQTIPDHPKEISATNAIARMVDGLGFRYRWATEGLTEKEINFRPVAGSMDMMELIKHIYDSALWVYREFGGDIEGIVRPKSFEGLRQQTLECYLKLSHHLRSMEDSALEDQQFLNRRRTSSVSFWYFVNGPIADAMTHVGQITSWRRIAGNPQPKGVNVFRGTYMAP